jgi:hypothetical protein
VVPDITVPSRPTNTGNQDQRIVIETTTEPDRVVWEEWTVDQWGGEAPNCTTVSDDTNNGPPDPLRDFIGVKGGWDSFNSSPTTPFIRREQDIPIEYFDLNELVLQPKGNPDHEHAHSGAP